ncbi:MmcQ/YjbR family DNA-binding protein [Flavobacterium humi]|uniref:MmcQ/YjbR family DNA-binding protein n=1 Tax=Flavobacterium humi TaxID=2562683 RepID=A0A4Z0L834_9FLAO|nr:MmcQ/YjbR family DNA-binding protein [Flavobacterium humi]TGD57954.1 MmcQ/YjbR family DNA-binding protein [Flavobacterium humi]
MIEIETFRKLALSFPETSEEPHFEKTSFRVGKKIFATYDLKTSLACLKLSEADQDIFSVSDKSIIYAVPNKWGKQGWTNVDLNKVHPDLCTDALKTAYCEVAPKKLSSQIRSDFDQES